MSESYRLSLGVFDGVFAVPNLVAERLRFTDAKALKPLLYLLRYGGQSVTVQELSRYTNLSPAEVRDGLDYWVGEGLLCRSEDGYDPDTAPRFAEPAVHAAPAPKTAPAVHPAPAAEAAPAAKPSITILTPADQGEAASVPSPIPAESVRKPSSRPGKLAPGEAASRCENDPAMQFMIRECEELLGRPLTSSDLSTLIALVDWAGLSPDLVLMLVGHCRDIGKTNLRYIEKVGADWANRGVDTHEKAESLIRRQSEEHARESEVMTAFGLHGRSLTSKEKGFITQWYEDFGFDLRMVRLAYERAVDRTGKLSFPYIHKVLQSWHQKGFHEPKDALNEAAPSGADAGRQSSLDLDFAESQLLKEE